ncbi:hypothetical protein AXX17_AT4G35970 [Arabidopsis thaliana]|uniref:Uncharacterized protein n=1 Tax=Arabidopsis thaliana TaxID=3702 RepID=A0A178V1X4_ARATH|nr:hypothetical protein AXX17_AT4G35970 [Arabidopsis thaliana]
MIHMSRYFQAEGTKKDQCSVSSLSLKTKLEAVGTIFLPPNITQSKLLSKELVTSNPMSLSKDCFKP